MELMRMPRGSSIAAARTKQSMAPLTRLAPTPRRIGSWLRIPLVSVKEPPSFMKSRPISTRLTWPISLSLRPTPISASVILANSPKCTLPAAAITASTLPTLSNILRIEPESLMSTCTSPLFEPAFTIWCSDSAATTNLPIVPLAPTTRIFMTGPPCFRVFSREARRHDCRHDLGLDRIGDEALFVRLVMQRRDVRFARPLVARENDRRIERDLGNHQLAALVLSHLTDSSIFVGVD